MRYSFDQIVMIIKEKNLEGGGKEPKHHRYAIAPFYSSDDQSIQKKKRFRFKSNLDQLTES